MKIYSAQTRAFYAYEFRADYEAANTWPRDGVEVSDERYEEIQNELSAGRQLSSDESGHPITIDSTPTFFTEAEQLAMRDARLANATAKITPLQDASDLGVATETELATLTAWKMHRVELMRLPESPGWPAEVEWPVTPEE